MRYRSRRLFPTLMVLAVIPPALAAQIPADDRPETLPLS